MDLHPEHPCGPLAALAASLCREEFGYDHRHCNRFPDGRAFRDVLAVSRGSLVYGTGSIDEGSRCPNPAVEMPPVRPGGDGHDPWPQGWFEMPEMWWGDGHGRIFVRRAWQAGAGNLGGRKGRQDGVGFSRPARPRVPCEEHTGRAACRWAAFH